jgi:hypothetical protein
MKRFGLALVLVCAACSGEPEGYRRVASLYLEDQGFSPTLLTPRYDERHIVSLEILDKGQTSTLLTFDYDEDRLVAVGWRDQPGPHNTFKWSGDELSAILIAEQSKQDLGYQDGHWSRLEADGEPFQRLAYANDRLTRIEKTFGSVTQVVDIVRDGDLIVATHDAGFESSVVYNEDGTVQSFPDAGFSVTYNAEGLIETITSPGQKNGRTATYNYADGVSYGLRVYPGLSYGTGPGPLFDMNGKPRSDFEVMSIDLCNPLRPWGVY